MVALSLDPNFSFYSPKSTFQPQPNIFPVDFDAPLTKLPSPGYLQLLEDYRVKHGKELSSLRKTPVPENIYCPVFGAPHLYLFSMMVKNVLKSVASFVILISAKRNVLLNSTALIAAKLCLSKKLYLIPLYHLNKLSVSKILMIFLLNLDLLINSLNDSIVPLNFFLNTTMNSKLLMVFLALSFFLVLTTTS